MAEHRCILSEKPDALDGAIEWLQDEIKKIESNNEQKQRVNKTLEDNIRPLVQKIAKQRGDTT